MNDTAWVGIPADDIAACIQAARPSSDGSGKVDEGEDSRFAEVESVSWRAVGSNVVTENVSGVGDVGDDGSAGSRDVDG